MATSTPPPRRIRVLCLHGFRTNAAVMENQMSGLRAALGDHAEFTFLNGPRVAGGPSEDKIEQLHANDKPFYEWVSATKATPDDEGFHEKRWVWKFGQLDECNRYLEETIRQIGPFDVVVGFSQGAIVASSLTMLNAHVYGDPTRLWKVCVCVGGSAVRGINYRKYFESESGKTFSIPIPSIHVIGKKDVFYNAGLRLVEQYDSFPTTASKTLTKRAFIHDGGHKFPTASKNPGLYEEIARLLVGHFAEKHAEGISASAHITPRL